MPTTRTAPQRLAIDPIDFAGAFAYEHTDVPPDVTLTEWRRARRQPPRRSLRAGSPPARRAAVSVTCEWCGGGVDPASTCARSIECPHCHAAPGHPCHRPSGHRADELHAARVSAAESRTTRSREPGPGAAGRRARPHLHAALERDVLRIRARLGRRRGLVAAGLGAVLDRHVLQL